MVAKDFIDLVAKFNYANRVSIEDFADQLNLFTVVLFLIACIIVTAKQYFLNSISCYIPVKPTGDNYNNYLTDFCWVHGTIPLRSDEVMPQTEAEWNEYDRLRRISECCLRMSVCARASVCSCMLTANTILIRCTCYRGKLSDSSLIRTSLNVCLPRVE